jgi:hypothetical protein
MKRMITVESPISATGPNGLHWSRWRIESEEQFRERVLEEATRLGVVVFFDREGFHHGHLITTVPPAL